MKENEPNPQNELNPQLGELESKFDKTTGIFYQRKKSLLTSESLCKHDQNKHKCFQCLVGTPTKTIDKNKEIRNLPKARKNRGIGTVYTYKGILVVNREKDIYCLRHNLIFRRCKICHPKCLEASNLESHSSSEEK